MRRHKHQRPATDKTSVWKKTLDKWTSGYAFPVVDGDYVIVNLNPDGTVSIELCRRKA